jgi:hypothetical protein
MAVVEEGEGSTVIGTVRATPVINIHMLKAALAERYRLISTEAYMMMILTHVRSVHYGVVMKKFP